MFFGLFKLLQTPVQYVQDANIPYLQELIAWRIHLWNVSVKQHMYIVYLRKTFLWKNDNWTVVFSEGRGKLHILPYLCMKLYWIDSFRPSMYCIVLLDTLESQQSIGNCGYIQVNNDKEALIYFCLVVAGGRGGGRPWWL